VFDRAERDNEAALAIEDSGPGNRVHSRIVFPGLGAEVEGCALWTDF
jgi:hypothetical protein